MNACDALPDNNGDVTDANVAYADFKEPQSIRNKYREANGRQKRRDVWIRN